MTQGLKLRRAGGSIAATLPKDMADRLHLRPATPCSPSRPTAAYCSPPTTRRPKRRWPSPPGSRALPQRASRTGQVAGGRPDEEPRWVDRLVVEAVQFDLISTHGGMPGTRDEHALESALARAPSAAPTSPRRHRRAGGGLRLRFRGRPPVQRRQQAHRVRDDGRVRRPERLRDRSAGGRGRRHHADAGSRGGIRARTSPSGYARGSGRRRSRALGERWMHDLRRSPRELTPATLLGVRATCP